MFDKTDLANPNKVRYPMRALSEALGNMLAHRDYELYDPVRITAFADRLEFSSPGALPLGVDPAALREGQAGPRWRNQVLAWFFNRLGLAQAEGQGIQTMLRVMSVAGCPSPTFEANEVRVTCTLGVNPLAIRTSARTLDSRDAWREILAQAIRDAGERGIRRADLAAALPQASAAELTALLRDLRRAGKAHSRGTTIAARWYTGQTE